MPVWVVLVTVTMEVVCVLDVTEVMVVWPGWPAAGVDMPAGMEAAGCCEVTTAGSLVTTVGCEVTTSGWPVTTPLELVSVRYWVAGLLYQVGG